MIQDDLFAALEAKERGMKAAASTSEAKAWIDLARFHARQVCLKSGSVTADDIRDLLPEPPTPHCVGSVFKAGFRFSGERRISTHKKNHGRELKVWLLQ